MSVPEGPRPESDALRRATEQLRAAPLPRAVEVADAVLRKTLAAPRRAQLVRSATDPHVSVSTLVIGSVVRAEVDAQLTGAAVQRVLVDVADDDTLAAVTLDLLVQYAVPIGEVADRARAVAGDVLATLLGETTAVVGVDHVHVSDVTVGDPHLVDPGDE